MSRGLGDVYKRQINYPWLFRLFDEVGYQGWIGCEYKPRGLTEEGLGWFDAWR